MLAGEMYDPLDPELMRDREEARRKVSAYNRTPECGLAIIACLAPASISIRQRIRFIRLSATPARNMPNRWSSETTYGSAAVPSSTRA